MKQVTRAQEETGQDVYYIAFMAMHWSGDYWIQIQKNNPNFDKTQYSGQSKTATTHKQALHVAKQMQRLQGGNDNNCPISDYSEE